MRHRIDKEGLINHYFRIRDYGFSHSKETADEVRRYSSFCKKDKDPLAGKDYSYIFYFLYDGKDPIIDKSRHLISIAVHSVQQNEVSDK